MYLVTVPTYLFT